MKVSPANLLKLADEMYMNSAYLGKVKDMMSRDDMVVFAAEQGGCFIGRCSLWLAPTDELEPRREIPGVPFINALEVHSDFYRRGIASSLVLALEEEVRERGMSQLALGVETQNLPARKLYEKLGYSYRKICQKDTYPAFWVEVLPNGEFKQNSTDAFLMMKELR